MVAWTRRKQTLYDMVVGTFVVFDEVEPGAPLPSQRPPMPWYGWVLNVLIVLGMAGMLLIIPMMLKLAREMPAQMTMIPLVSAVESARSQGCQAGKRPLPDRALGTIEVAPGLVGVCRVTLQLADTDQVPEALRGERIELTHGVDGWSCSSRVPAEHLPPHWSCR
jgi:hypothetical protein